MGTNSDWDKLGPSTKWKAFLKQLQGAMSLWIVLTSIFFCMKCGRNFFPHLYIQISTPILGFSASETQQHSTEDPCRNLGSLLVASILKQRSKIYHKMRSEQLGPLSGPWARVPKQRRRGQRAKMKLQNFESYHLSKSWKMRNSKLNQTMHSLCT